MMATKLNQTRIEPMQDKRQRKADRQYRRYLFIRKHGTTILEAMVIVPLASALLYFVIKTVFS